MASLHLQLPWGYLFVAGTMAVCEAEDSAVPSGVFAYSAEGWMSASDFHGMVQVHLPYWVLEVHLSSVVGVVH